MRRHGALRHQDDDGPASRLRGGPAMA